ncbi:MAG TPA: ABC transporter permease [Gemmatimonadaceae bacterium]|nr:ABC transporter permease [Gemmatimonadaceae bacterium]
MSGDLHEPMWRRYRRFLRSNIAADVDEEIEFHLAMRSQDYEARGLPRDAALAAARQRFGDVRRVAGWLRRHDIERERARRAGEIVSGIHHNLRAGVRALITQPTFTAAAVLTLALGIGATTAMFSVVYGVLLRPLPFSEPDRLVRVWTHWKDADGRGAVSAANARDWRAQNHVFEDVALVKNNQSFNFTVNGEPERLLGVRAWASLFPILRAKPLIGRTFTEQENEIGHENVAVLSYQLWVRRFGSDASIVGKTILLNGVPTTVIGVMKPEFRYPSRAAELWTPLTVTADEYTHRSWGSYSAVARLKPGVTLDQARADLHVVSVNLARQYADNKEIEAGITPLLEDMVGRLEQPLFVLLGAVGAMLLIGCANLTNLLLARGLSRRREIAVRTALGASRARLVEQSITELVPLLALGAAAGLLTATWVIRALVPVLPADLPRTEGIGIDLPVLGFTTLVVMVIALLVGAWPALDAARSAVSAGLSELSRGSTATRRRGRVRDALVVAQIAATLLLLVGATVLVRSFLAVRAVSPGFNPEGVLSVQVAIPESRYPRDDQIVGFYTGVLDRVQTLPGVIAVGVVNRLPLGGDNQNAGLEIEDAPPHSRWPNVLTRTVSPGYFRALEIPIKEGRSFTRFDESDAPRVAIIDERLARAMWPGASPIGRRIREGGDVWATVVGVVGHIRHSALDDDSDPQVYWNYTQRVQNRLALVVKTRGNPASLSKAVAAAVRDVDPEQAVYDVRTLAAVVDRSLGERWLQTILLTTFAGAALLLASVGAYGVIAYGVGQRTREFGVRMALGAGRGNVMGMVLRRGATLFALGALTGLVLASVTVRVLSTLVYGVAPHDVASFVLATAVLFVVSMLACYVPALRASRVSPSVALQSD